MENGNIDLAQTLIEVGASLDLQDSSGRYFWFMYFSKAFLLICRYLISQKYFQIQALLCNLLSFMDTQIWQRSWLNQGQIWTYKTPMEGSLHDINLVFLFQFIDFVETVGLLSI